MNSIMRSTALIFSLLMGACTSGETEEAEHPCTLAEKCIYDGRNSECAEGFEWENEADEENYNCVPATPTRVIVTSGRLCQTAGIANSPGGVPPYRYTLDLSVENTGTDGTWQVRLERRWDTGYSNRIDEHVMGPFLIDEYASMQVSDSYSIEGLRQYSVTAHIETFRGETEPYEETDSMVIPLQSFGTDCTEVEQQESQ